MVLTLYNTLTRRQELFEPLEPGKVRMYCCGVTVYDYCHLGHARSYIVWDTVRRYLQWRGYDVTYVQNFTDIDDKIIRRSQQEGISWDTVTAKYIQAYQEDMARLNIQPADRYPKATEVIPQITAFIQRLIDQGMAYEVAGDVYYAVERFPTYGKLSGRKLEDLEAGASGRVDDETEAKKRHPMDFALWKSAKPGEPEWDSPWGKGRPGWHIECSVMVREELGDSIDIHTGGQDLIFPHHENEIAQSEGAIAQPLSRYWMHNGFVNISGEKMSKSLNNFTTIRAFLDNGVDPMVLRLFVLQAHYRKPIDFTDEAIASAQNAWSTLKDGLLFGQQFGAQFNWNLQQEVAQANLDTDARVRFEAAMDDDFNTSGSLAVLFELAKELRRDRNLLTHEGATDTPLELLKKRWDTLKALAKVLGLEAQGIFASVGSATAEATVHGITAQMGISEAEIEDLIQQRKDARKAKNFKESDRIRDLLKSYGIELIDLANGEVSIKPIKS